MLNGGVHCPNLTRLINEYLASLGPTTDDNSTLTSTNDTTNTADRALLLAQETSQRNAVVYIVVVLLFYSFGIGLMMVKYMRKEAEEREELKLYRRYTHGAAPTADPTSRARLPNRLALQALNMVNAIPQTGTKVTFV